MAELLTDESVIKLGNMKRRRGRLSIARPSVIRAGHRRSLPLMVGGSPRGSQRCGVKGPYVYNPSSLRGWSPEVVAKYILMNEQWLQLRASPYVIPLLVISRDFHFPALGELIEGMANRSESD